MPTPNKTPHTDTSVTEIRHLPGGRSILDRCWKAQER